MHTRQYNPQEQNNYNEQPQPHTEKRAQIPKEITPPVKQNTVNSSSNQSYAKRQYLLRIQQTILTGRLELALERLEASLDGRQHAWIAGDFVGLGNKQNWCGMCPNGRQNWLQLAKRKTWLRGNLYDYVSLCLALLTADRIDVKKHLAWYQTMRQSKGPTLQILMGLGNIHYNCNRWTAAMRCYQEASELCPQNGKVWEYMAWIHGFSWDRNISAVDFARRAYSIDPSNIQARFIQIFCRYYNEQLLLHLQKLIEMDPSYYRTRTCYIANLKSPQFKRQYAEFIEAVDPEYRMYVSARGYYAFNQQKNEEALQIFAKFKELYPDSHVSYIHYSKALNKLGKIENAKEMLQKSIQLCPEFQDAYQELAEIYSQEGKVERGKTILEKCVKISPDVPQIWNSLGCSQQEQGNPQKSLEYFKKALELQPESIKYIINVALIYIELNNTTQAEAILDRVDGVRQEWKDAERLQIAASVYLQDLFNLEKAIKLYSKCYELGYQDSGKICSTLVKPLLEANRVEQALQWMLKGEGQIENLLPTIKSHQNWLKIPTQRKRQLIFYVFGENKYMTNSAEYGLLFAELFDSVGLYSQALACYQHCNQIIQTQNTLSAWQRFLLEKAYGRNPNAYQRLSRGKVTIIERLRYLKDITEYERYFKSMYDGEEEKKENEVKSMINT